MTTRLFPLLFLVTISALGPSAGCRSAATPVTFYTLSAADPPPPMEAGVSRNLVIALGPVRFPDVLDRPQIVTRTGPNRLHVSEFHQWGGNLEREFVDVLAENLANRLATPRVIIHPSKDNLDPDFRISMDIQQFEGWMGKTARLKAAWSLWGRERGTGPLVVRRSLIQTPVSGDGYDALVSTLSVVVDRLSEEIATAILTISTQR